MVAGLFGYVVYRRRVRPCAAVARRRRRRPRSARRWRSSTGRSSSPSWPGEQAREAMHVAARLAAERRSTIVAMRVIVVPLDLPLNAELPEQEALADALLDEAHDDRRPLRRPRCRARRPRSQRRRRDRRRGRTAKRGDRRHGRAAAASPHAHERDLRQDGRLRAPQRALPRDDRRGQESCADASDGSSFVFAAVLIALGVALVVQTARAGGGVGYLLGVLFVGLGAGRLYLLRSEAGEELMARKLPVVPTSPRRADAVLGRVRRDRVVDLLRARHHRRPRARADARGAAADGAALPRRRAVVRRGHHRDPGDGRRGHPRAQGVQRLRRLLHRLGAVPRLPHRHHALGALPAALPRRGARDRRAAAAPVGRRRRRGGDPRHRRRAPVPAARPLHGRHRRRRARPRDAAARRRARASPCSSRRTR